MKEFRQQEIDIIDPNTEMHYAILSSFQNTQFPHSHDFFEFFLLIEGTQFLQINKHSLTLKAGSLVLIRPNDVHSREYLTRGYHINIAFSSKIAKAMFEYLGSGFPKEELLNLELPPYIVLSKTESSHVRSRLDKLNAVRMKSTNLQRTMLRTLIIDIFANYFSRCVNSNVSNESWFTILMHEMETPQNLIAGLPAMLEISDKSHEHLCRIFRQNLNCTPTEYINDLRLNYAANFLIHSDLSIIDICLSSGFDNVSHFYHLFKKKFGVTPRQFRMEQLIPVNQIFDSFESSLSFDKK